MADKLTKRCIECGEIKPLDEFGQHSHHKDGRSNRCKECKRVYNRQYRAAHADEEASRNRQYKRQNRTRLLAYYREYYQRNREAALAYARQYHQENRGERRAYNQQYKQENRAKIAAQKMRRQNREQNGAFTKEEWEELCERYGNICLRCGKDGQLTVDHVISLAMGGTNDIGNIQPLCLSCNSQKFMSVLDWRGVC